MRPGSGAELACRYYEEVVGPLLAARRPGLRYAAGRLGSGSDVLGVDDAESRDHDWGLRLTVLVDADDVSDISALLAAELPDSFAELPIRFATSWDPTLTDKVEVSDPTSFATSRLGVSPARLDPSEEVDPLDWLRLTGQSVLEVTAGPVFIDTPGTITAIRDRLAWYPHDIWLYVVACAWQRLSQELPMVGRTAEAGDDLGSRVIAGRLCRDVIHLAFMLERTWPPYPKWLGTQLRTLPAGEVVTRALTVAMSADNCMTRQDGLVNAISALHERQREVGLPTAEAATEQFWNRSYRTVPAAAISILTREIGDPAVRRLPIGVGSVEQWIDNADVLSNPARRAQLTDGWRNAIQSAP